mmetsp:Transcript_29161/g.93347  ORF Transcript_29161/g.93347 Transcript_29161/m.93347 type:complete len:541 (-) Transcript_29161:284-1906(-)
MAGSTARGRRGGRGFLAARFDCLVGFVMGALFTLAVTGMIMTMHTAPTPDATPEVGHSVESSQLRGGHTATRLEPQTMAQEQAPRGLANPPKQQPLPERPPDLRDRPEAPVQYQPQNQGQIPVQPNPMPEAQPKPLLQPQDQAKPPPQAQSNPQPNPGTHPKPQPPPQPQPQPKTETKILPEAQAQAQPQPQPQAGSGSAPQSSALALAPDPLLGEDQVPDMIIGACGKDAVRPSIKHLSPSHPSVAEGNRPFWCLDQPAPPMSSPVYLAAAVHVRLYPDDLAGLNPLDLAHWLTYYRYSGVERVFLYDTWLNNGESFRDFEPIKAGIDSGYVQYVDWHATAARNIKPGGGVRMPHIAAVQEPATNDAQRLAGGNVRWMTHTDMDEYPFVEEDNAPGFLARTILRAEKKETVANVSPDARNTQYKLANIIVQGGRGNTTLGPMLIQQVTRRFTSTINALVKQIVRVDAAKRHHVHWSELTCGKTKLFDSGDKIRMNHFWGGRGLGWKMISELTPEKKRELYGKSVENDLKGIPEQVLRCF